MAKTNLTGRWISMEVLLIAIKSNVGWSSDDEEDVVSNVSLFTIRVCSHILQHLWCTNVLPSLIHLHYS